LETVWRGVPLRSIRRGGVALTVSSLSGSPHVVRLDFEDTFRGP
jgi:hypothetical protein